MSVLSKYFDKSVNQSSPVQKDFVRKVNYDEDGNEYIVYEEVDYPELIASLGVSSDWSLSTLLKAGVNPAFSIHTVNPTRLEGIGVINQAVSDADSIFAEIERLENEDSK